MMSALLSLSLLALVLSHNSFAQLLDERCQKGIESQNFNTPWMASVYNGNEFICAGTLVHKLFVLTAATCIKERSQLFVRLGEFCATSQCNNIEQYGVAIAIQHRDFVPIENTNDIGLLRLRGEVVYNAHIRPICIILDDVITSAPIPKFIAFGEHENHVQQTIFLTHRKSFECYRNGKILHNKQICTGSVATPCMGNTGGPLVAYFNYGGEKLTVQFGIVKNGSELCNSESIHTDVSAYKEWIYNTVRNYETEGDRVLYEECSSNWTADVIVRLWEVSLFENTFSGALITNPFTPIKVETKYHERFDVESIYKHPQFKYSLESIENNIALLKLTQKVPNSDLVKPICIVLNPTTPRTLTALVDVITEDFMGVKKLTLSLIDHSICAQKIGVPLEPSQFCVEKPLDLNNENPGSILGLFRNISGIGRYLLFSIKNFERAGLIVYTNIQSYGNWIVNTVNDD
ncbi:kallikrein-6 isoform X2 [Drosophila rhopaloa]|uniref:Kallikrein-6 isoform X2 n=1 Tax=Drosophila rhopaloa TaxID=1041015 RepID=A0A6P4FDE8_DRORH|nr:kallikrein-6 isoform X2 [Drosophila rhopaloa]